MKGLPHKPEARSLDPQCPGKNQCVVVCACNPSIREVDAGGSMELAGQPVWLNQ